MEFPNTRLSKAKRKLRSANLRAKTSKLKGRDSEINHSFKFGGIEGRKIDKKPSTKDKKIKTELPKKVYDLDKLKANIEHSAKPSTQAKRPRKNYKEYKEMRDRQEAAKKKDSDYYERDQKVRKEAMEELTPRQRTLLKGLQLKNKTKKLEHRIKVLKKQTPKPMLS